MTFLVGLLLLSVVVAGVGISYLADVDFTIEERVGYGAFFGLLLYVISALVTTRMFGFNGGAVVAAIALALGVSGFGWREGANQVTGEVRDLVRRTRGSPRDAGNHVLFLAFLIPAWIWVLRTLTIAYRHADGAIFSGNLAVFSDWQAHSTYTASFAYAGNTGFDLPTATGWGLAYHNGINYFAATLIPAGASLQAALTISSGFCAVFFPLAMYLAGHRIFSSRWIAALGTAIFFFFGGLGWTHFFSTNRRQNPADLASPELTNMVDNGLFATLGNLPTRYTRFYDAGYWMENSVVGHLYPQRPTLIGFPVTIIAVMLLWTAYQQRSTRTFLFVGVMVGAMPFFHLFGFGTPFILGIVWAFFAQFEDRTFAPETDRLRFIALAVMALVVFAVAAFVLPWHQALAGAAVIAAVAALFVQQDEDRPLEWRMEWLWFLVPAFVLSMPVVWFMRPPESNPDWGFSWAVNAIQGDETDPTTGFKRLTANGERIDVGFVQTIWENIRFWFKNFGFFLPLLVGAQVWRGVIPRRIALALVPVWLWFIVPTFTRLHPWSGNNTHYLIFVVLLGAFPVAALLLHIFRRYALVGLVVPFIIFSMTFSGALDLWHSGDTDTEAWDLMTASDVLVADWVRDNTEGDDVFVVADDNTHPMSSLTGRPIVAGFNGWIFDLGIPDWWTRTQESAQILQGAPETPMLLEKYAVDYVVIGPRERNFKAANDDYWSVNGREVYNFGGYRIFKVS